VRAQFQQHLDRFQIGGAGGGLVRRTGGCTDNGGQGHDQVGVFHGTLNRGPVTAIAPDHGKRTMHTALDQAVGIVHEVVQDRHFMAGRQQRRGHDGTEVARAARD
jgi:hypothetical protein